MNQKRIKINKVDIITIHITIPDIEEHVPG